MSDATATVSILGDVSEYLESIKKAQETTSEFGEKAKEGIGELGEKLKEVAEFVGLAMTIEELKEIALHSLEAAEQVSHLSQSLGVSTQTLQTMAFAAGMVGGSLDDVSGSLAKMERSAVQAASGNAQAAEAFRALGISAEQLPELMKDPNEMMIKLAENVSNLADGEEKTAAIMQVFGRGAAQMIPFLNELGKNYEELKEKSEAFGVTLSGPEMQAMEQANEALDLLKLAGTGLANQFTEALAPAIAEVADGLTYLAETGVVKDFFIGLGDSIREAIVIGGQLVDMFRTIGSAFNELGITSNGVFDGMGGDLVSFIQECQDDFAELVRALSVIWANIETGGELVWIGIKGVFDKFLDDTLSEVADWSAKLAGSFSSIGLDGVAAKFTAAAQSIASSATYAAENTAEWNDALQRNQNAIDAADAALVQSKQNNAEWAEGTRLSANATKILSENFDEFSRSLVKGDAVGNANKLNEAIQGLKQSAGALIGEDANAESVQRALDDVVKQYTNTVQKADAAQVHYNASMKDHSADAAKLAEELGKYDEFLDSLSANIDGPYAAAQDKFNATMDKGVTAIVSMMGKGMLLEQAMELLNITIDKGTAAMDKSIADDYVKHDAADSLIQKIMDENNALLAQTDAQKAAAEITKIAAANMLTLHDVYGEAHNTIQEVTDANAKLTPVLQQQIEALLAQQDAIKKSQQVQKEWQGIMTNGFDSVGKDIADFVTGTTKSWSAFGDSLVKTAEQMVAQIIEEFLKLEVINPIINSLFGLSGSSALPMGNMLSGLLGGGGTAAGGLANLIFGGGAGGAAGVDSSFLNGGGLIDKLFGGADSGPLSSMGGFGGLALTLGSILAGVNEFKNAGGGLAGAAGGLAYGYGTYVAGTTLIGAGAGLAAGGIGGAFAGGIGALGAMGPVGWVALAAMAIDMLSGGNLFGTSKSPTGMTRSNIDITGEGGTIKDEYEQKKKEAFFGGNSYSWSGMDTPKAQADAVTQMWQQIHDATQQGATLLNTDIKNFIDGTYYQKFDKSGKVVDSYATVMGEQYKDTIQQFATRVTADNLLALLPAAQEAFKIAQQWQSSADTLMQGTQMLVQAQVDINKGQGLLGTTDTSLADITSVVQSLAQKNETLIQTYSRLQTETQDVSSILEKMGLVSNYTGEDFVKFADSLATAAGGINNLNSAWQSYYSAYYSSNEQLLNSLDQYKNAVTSTFGAIGEDTNVSMDQFKADFTAKFPTLTADQVVQWLAASQALATYAKTLGLGTDQVVNAEGAYKNFVDQFANIQPALTQFESSMAQIGNTLTSNIGKADSLAQAMGMAGASQADVNNIIAATAQLAVQAIGQFRLQAQQLSDSLFGTQLAKDQKQKTDAVTLMSDLGQLGAVTGESFAQLASEMQIPLDQFAKILGTTQDQLQGMFDQQEKAAMAALDTALATKQSAQFLSDIRDILAGRVPDTTQDLTATATAGVSTKPVPVTAEVKTQQAIDGLTSSTKPATAPATAPLTDPTTQRQLADMHNTLQLIQLAINGGTTNNTQVGNAIVAAITTRNIQQTAQSYSGPRSIQPPRVSLPQV